MVIPKLKQNLAGETKGFDSFKVSKDLKIEVVKD